MFRKIALFAVVSLLAMLPSTLIAGGPPRLCLPIDGVTANSLAACTDLLATKLDSKLWSSSTSDRGVRILENKTQWYAMLTMKEDIGLAEVDAALKGSGYSIPRDRLHIFGHMILEIQGSSKSAAELLAKLDALPHVSIDESESHG